MKLRKDLLLSVLIGLNLSAFAGEALDCSVAANANAVITSYKGVLGSAARTIECWVKTSASNQMFLGYGSTQGAAGTLINMGTNESSSQGAVGALRVEVGSSAYVGTTLINDNQWHHVAVTFSGTSNDTLKIWVDGVMEDNVPHAAATINTLTGGDVRIGADQTGTRDFSGLVDELRIWNVALTQSQLLNLSTQELGFNGSSPKEVAADTTLLWSNLEVYYTFNALDGSNNIPDRSDNLRIGALENATLTTSSGGKDLGTLTPVMGIELTQKNETLSWTVEHEAGVAHYLVQQLINGVWTTVEQLAAGSTQYEIQLPNGSEARLIAVDQSGFVQEFLPTYGSLIIQNYVLENGWN